MAEIFKINAIKNKISGSNSWNTNIINAVKVEGEKRVPSFSRMLLQKTFAVSPYSLRTKANIQKVQEVTTLSKVNWSEDRAASQVATDEQKMLISFQEPVLIGSGNYRVVYGDPAAIYHTGSLAHDGEDRARYYEITNTLGTPADYFVMCSNRNEFRVCTAEDYDEMVDDSGNWVTLSGGGNAGAGSPPSDRNDVKTDAHFYIKQMNGAYGKNDTKYIVYNTKSENYYIDENGIVQPGSKAVNDPGQAAYTSYPEKAADITVRPVDLSGNPLFQWHGVSGDQGYNNSADFNNVNDPSYAMQITKVQVNSEAVNVDYVNYAETTQFFLFVLSGYPLSMIETIVHEIDPDKAEARRYGRRSASVQNKFICRAKQAEFLANIIRDNNHIEKDEYAMQLMFSPHLELEDIVRFTDDSGDRDMEIVEIVDKISPTQATTDIKGHEVNLDKSQIGPDTFDNSFDESFK